MSPKIGPFAKQLLQNTNHAFVSLVCETLAHTLPQNGQGIGEQLGGEVRRTTGRFNFGFLLGIGFFLLFCYIA